MTANLTQIPIFKQNFHKEIINFFPQKIKNGSRRNSLKMQPFYLELSFPFYDCLKMSLNDFLLWPEND